MHEIRIGALRGNPYGEWPQLLHAGARTDELGDDSRLTRSAR